MDDMTDKTFKCLYCVLLTIALFWGSPFRTDAKVKNPFDVKIDTGLNIGSETLADADKDAFRLNACAVPEKVAPGQNFVIEVSLDIAPKYQVYEAETSVTPPEISGFTFGKVRAVSSVFEKSDPFLGKIKIYKEKALFEIPVSADKSLEPGPKTISLKVRYLGCTDKVCFLPRTEDVKAVFIVVSEAGATMVPPPVLPVPPMIQNSEIPPTGEPNSFQETAEKFGLIGVLVAAFIWGFLASLTPCVYPMIPVTVSVIGARSAGSIFRGFVLSVFYVLGLSLTYAIFGTVAAMTGGMFGEYTNHPAVRIVVAAVFVILALGMFDLFYIQMPSFLSSKIGGFRGSGLIGVFITGAAAGAVVGPCVGPMLVGLLVYIAALGSKLQGFLIMWSFALGMGMLFLVIGTFSGAATSLPKAGMWMERVKHFFGVLLLAAALYYVEPLLPEKVFFLTLGAFLMGIGVFVGAFDPLSAESKPRNRFWKTAGLLFLVLGIAYTAKFVSDGQIYLNKLSGVAPAKDGITWLRDEAFGLAQAKSQQKPLMMDFSAEWCTACKQMDRETFSDPRVIRMSKQFVCVKIDCTDTSAPEVRRLQKKYKLVGLPTILFMNSAGKLVPDTAVTEFVKAGAFLERMRTGR